MGDVRVCLFVHFVVSLLAFCAFTCFFIPPPPTGKTTGPCRYMPRYFALPRKVTILCLLFTSRRVLRLTLCSLASLEIRIPKVGRHRNITLSKCISHRDFSKVQFVPTRLSSFIIRRPLRLKVLILAIRAKIRYRHTINIVLIPTFFKSARYSFLPPAIFFLVTLKGIPFTSGLFFRKFQQYRITVIVVTAYRRYANRRYRTR